MTAVPPPPKAPSRTGRSAGAARSPGLLTGGRRRTTGLIVVAALLVVVTMASLVYGARPIPIGSVLAAFFDYSGADDQMVVREFRVPRTLLGLGVGAALGLAGAVMQGLTRNPLADPGLLGVEAGAALGVVTAIYAWAIGTLTGHVWFAFAGAALASVWERYHTEPCG